jgi:hypothetical protein
MSRTASRRRIGFVATRFSGTDGVSLEMTKWLHVIEFDGFMTDETVWWTERLLQDPELVAEMTAHNYAVAARHYSYAVLRRHLRALLTDVFGEPAG